MNRLALYRAKELIDAELNGKLIYCRKANSEEDWFKISLSKNWGVMEFEFNYFDFLISEYELVVKK